MGSFIPERVRRRLPPLRRTRGLELAQLCPQEIASTINEVVESARGERERAAWVAWTGCQDGSIDSPYPGIPELQLLRRS
jgi:hypothetical protein